MSSASDKKICFISTEFAPGPGGIGAHAFNIINELKALGWNFTVFTLQDNASEAEINTFNKQYHSKIVSLFPSPSVVSLIKKVISLLFAIRKENPGIIISSGKHSIWFGAIVKLFLRKPFIVIAHGTEFGYLSERNFKTTAWAVSKADLVVAVSKYTLEFLKKNNYSIQSNKVIYNGADPELFYKLENSEISNFRRSHKIEDQFIITTLGNVSYRKGQLEMIRSLPKILKKHPNVHYYCIGLPGMKNEFIQEAEKLNVQNHVHFLGRLPQEEIKLWLNCTHLFAMLSTHTKEDDFEGFGIAVIEAALCGVPAIVTSNTSGVIESIVHNETGIGIPEKEYDSISNTVIYLIENPEQLKNMGNKAYDRATKDFTWGMQAGKYDSSFKGLISK